MKKMLPSIIFLVLLAGILATLVFLFKCYGLGPTVVGIGVLLVVVGLFGFIFFLSIDPGYGWSKVGNLNTNYVVISVAVFVCLIGVAVYCAGREIHETARKSEKEESRCYRMLSGQVKTVVGSEWFQLSDSNMVDGLRAYLFQKRGEDKKYKVVLVGSSENSEKKVRKVMISSDAIGEPVVINAKNGECSKVFEGDFNTNRSHLLQHGQERQIEYDLTVIYYDNGESCNTDSNSLHLSLAQ